MERKHNLKIQIGVYHDLQFRGEVHLLQRRGQWRGRRPPRLTEPAAKTAQPDDGRLAQPAAAQAQSDAGAAGGE